MKTLIFLLFIPCFSFGQTNLNGWSGIKQLDIANGYYYATPLEHIDVGSIIDTTKSEAKLSEMTPFNKITFCNQDKSFSIDFSGDSLIVFGDLKPNEQAKVFIDYCRIYMRLKIDSLETQLELKDIHLKNYKEMLSNERDQRIKLSKELDLNRDYYLNTLKKIQKTLKE